MATRARRLRASSSRNGLGGLPAPQLALVLAGVVSLAGLCVGAEVAQQAGDALAQPPPKGRAEETQEMLARYFREMSVPKPFLVRTGADWEARRREVRQKLLESIGLAPLPDRVPLDIHQSAPLDHPWCTVRRVYYQLWPGLYASGLLYMPKEFRQRPAPAMLCPHGHWAGGNAHPEVQRRCLNFARLGYVTFSPPQSHYEDLAIGVSHQTLMVWGNMRALDYLESLAEVDKTKIGAAGASGGGLQTEMLVALDSRINAATIVGLTCDFREILFPHTSHCACNHFPGVMQFTDHPEISALGFPTPVMYLTMNDWTKKFEHTNFPTIQRIYADGGFADRVFCRHFDTPHTYDKQKREYTYGWMERWLHGRASHAHEDAGMAPAEPETKTFAPDTLVNLAASVPGDKGLAEISRIYERQHRYRAAPITSAADWEAYRDKTLVALKGLLGEAAILPRTSTMPAVPAARMGPTRSDGNLLVQCVECPSEGGLLVPAIIVRPAKPRGGKLPMVVMFGATPKESLFAAAGPDSARALAERGCLVVLPDVRTFGEMFATDPDRRKQAEAWERNGIVWGRSVLGMAATDLRGLLDAVAARPDADASRITVVARGSGDLAMAAILAAALDPRIAALDVDLAGCCFAKRNLALVPHVLQHGDVLQWAALLARRTLTLHKVPPEAGDTAWLAAAFRAVGNAGALRIDTM